MKMRTILTVYLLVAGMLARGQLIVNSTNAPHQAGQFTRFYYNTNNTDVPSMLVLVNGTNQIPSPIPGVTNYPQTWNFSKPQQSNEIVLRTDIVAVSNAPESDAFSAAQYVERDTFEPDNQIAWRYYSLTNLGRLYHGFYNPVEDNADYLVEFGEPTLDLPATIQYGQKWTRAVTWHGFVMSLPIDYYFHTAAEVDSSGALSLPGIGMVPSIRVHEIHRYQANYLSFPIVLYTNHYYYWLSREVGVAVQIFQLSGNTLSPFTPPLHTNTVLRMFEASFYTNSVPSISLGNLRLQIQAGAAVLNWDAFSNSTSYRIESVDSISDSNWQSLGLSTNRTWNDTLTTTQRFYRVVGLP